LGFPRNLLFRSVLRAHCTTALSGEVAHAPPQACLPRPTTAFVATVHAVRLPNSHKTVRHATRYNRMPREPLENVKTRHTTWKQIERSKGVPRVPWIKRHAKNSAAILTESPAHITGLCYTMKCAAGVKNRISPRKSNKGRRYTKVLQRSLDASSLAEQLRCTTLVLLPLGLSLQA